jgi:hypothetical protein
MTRQRNLGKKGLDKCGSAHVFILSNFPYLTSFDPQMHTNRVVQPKGAKTRTVEPGPPCFRTTGKSSDMSLSNPHLLPQRANWDPRTPSRSGMQGNNKATRIRMRITSKTRPGDNCVICSHPAAGLQKARSGLGEAMQWECRRSATARHHWLHIH